MPTSVLTGRLSVRVRLTAVATLVIALVLAVTAALLVWRVHTALLDGLDTAARQQAAVAATAVGEAGPSPFPAAGAPTGVGQVIDRAGAVVGASTEIEGEPALYDFPVGTAVSPQVRTVSLSQLDGTDYRVAGVAVPGEAGLRLYLGLPLTEVSRGTTELATALAIGAPGLLLVLSLLTWAYAGQALRPVDDLLGRLDDSLRRQRQFVADAAHELRSPVAAMRAQLEVDGVASGNGLRPAGGHGPSAEPDAQERTATLLEESVRLSALVDDLLALARIDAQPVVRREQIDLDDVVFAETRLLRQRSSEVVDTTGVRAVRVIGDPGLLHRVVRNLLDNAARYARGRITVTCGPADGAQAAVCVADDGPGIPADQRSAVLERFTRLDDARTRTTGGVGLGLAIVHDVVAAHHGRLEIADNAPGARITFWLPRDAASDAPLDVV